MTVGITLKTNMSVLNGVGENVGARMRFRHEQQQQQLPLHPSQELHTRIDVRHIANGNYFVFPNLYPSLQRIFHQRQSLFKIAAVCLLFVILFSGIQWVNSKVNRLYRDFKVRAFYNDVLSKQRLVPPPFREVTTPKDVRVSVVLMNHGRPYMIQKSTLIPTLLEHENIDEILLCHSNPKTKFQLVQPKVKNIDATEMNKKIGLALRFHYCQDAKNPWVIIVDDDQEVTANAIDQLLSEFNDNPRRIVGRYGRGYSYWSAPSRYGYNTDTLLGDVEVVLTKFMILERQLCYKFFNYAHVINDILPESKPLWNAEDIFMSLTANHVYKVPLYGPYNNYAMPLDVKEADDKLYNDGDGNNENVSGNLDRINLTNSDASAYWSAYNKAQTHTRYRGRLWYLAKTRLAALDDVP
jgi:Glycosyl transferase family 64 domain